MERLRVAVVVGLIQGVFEWLPADAAVRYSLFLHAGTAVAGGAFVALVGYATIGGLVELVRRVAFWEVCAGLGTLAVLGGLLALL